MLYSTISPYIIGDTKDWRIHRVTPKELEEIEFWGGSVVPFTRINTKHHLRSQMQALLEAVRVGVPIGDYLENHELIAVSYPDYIFGKMPSYTWVTEEYLGDNILVEGLPRGILWLDLKRGLSGSRLLKWSSKAPLVTVNGSKLIKGSLLRRELVRYNCRQSVEDDEVYLYTVEVPPIGSHFWRLEFVSIKTGRHYAGLVLRRETRKRRC